MTAKPNMALRLGAVVFALLWTAWMVLWSGSHDLVDIFILGLCGIAVGYVWYRAMRWQFRRKSLLPPAAQRAD
jgi:hypothetical protein